MRTCLFCGNAADSREHVFAERLTKRMEAGKFEIVVGKLREGEAPIGRKAHLLTQFKVRCVCKKCNNGWMNELEDWFERRLGFLIERRWPNLADEMLKVVIAEKELLARWLLKTAVMMDQASLTEKVFMHDVTLQMKGGYVTPDTIVDVGYVATDGVAAMFRRGFQIFNGGKYEFNQEHRSRQGYNATIQMNHLVLRMARIPDARGTYFALTDALPVRVYPDGSERAIRRYRYRDIFEFDRAFVLEAGLAASL